MSKKEGFTLNTKCALIDAIENAIVVVCAQSGITPGDVEKWLEAKGFPEVLAMIRAWEIYRKQLGSRNSTIGALKHNWLRDFKKKEAATPHPVSPVATPEQAKKTASGG